MVGKLVTLVALFTLVLASAAFANPDTLDMGAEIEAQAGDVDRESLVGERLEEEAEFQLYLGPQTEGEITVEADRPGVDN